MKRKRILKKIGKENLTGEEHIPVMEQKVKSHYFVVVRNFYSGKKGRYTVYAINKADDEDVKIVGRELQLSFIKKQNFYKTLERIKLKEEEKKKKLIDRYFL